MRTKRRSALKRIVLRGGGKRREKKDKQKAAEVKKNWTGGKGQTLSPAQGIESSEAGCVPWVRLESVVRCMLQTVRSASENFVNDEGPLPFWLELVLFLL